MGRIMSWRVVLYVLSLIHTLYIWMDRLIEHCAEQQARSLRHAQIPTKARLTYFQDKSLSLDMLYASQQEYSNCFTLSSADANITIPSVAYLGLSAETGELSDNHDILSLKTQNLYSVSSHAGRRPSSNTRFSQQQQKKKKGGWLWFFFKIIFFIGLVAGGLVGWKSYQAKQRSRF